MRLISAFCERLGRLKPLVFGMIHVPALPGSPCSSMSIENIVKHVRHEAKLYANAGLDGLIVENMHDQPYNLPPARYETVASMTRMCMEVAAVLDKQRSQFLLGIQVLACANQEALSIAQTTGFDFIRAEGFVFAHVADEGFVSGCAGPLLRYRRQIGAENIAIFADIKKKHSSHAITADVSVEETAKAAQFFLADGVILTGTATGEPASTNELQSIRKHCPELPILVGSGITIENAPQFTSADAFIIGSYFKKNGHWANELCTERIQQFMEQITIIRSKNFV